MANKPRIAIVGFVLESNGHAPVVGRDDFIRFSGQEILDDLRRDAPRSPAELSGFVDRLTALRDWEPVPITIQSGGAAGPVDQAFFDGFMAEVNDRLAAAGPVDGVYFPEHGAGTATTDPDPDGTLMARVREIVGPRARLIASLDLHANVNDVMAGAVDMMCSYLTNPHVDQYARGTECAEAMHAMLDGLTTAVGFAKLPLIPPSIAQNTKAGPYADHIAFGQSLLGDGVMNVSLCSGFSLGDTVKNGMSVTVTSRGDKGPGGPGGGADRRPRVGGTGTLPGHHDAPRGSRRHDAGPQPGPGPAVPLLRRRGRQSRRRRPGQHALHPERLFGGGLPRRRRGARVRPGAGGRSPRNGARAPASGPASIGRRAPSIPIPSTGAAGWKPCTTAPSSGAGESAPAALSTWDRRPCWTATAWAWW